MVTKKQMVKEIDNALITKLTYEQKKSLLKLRKKQLRIIWSRVVAETGWRRGMAMATKRFKEMVGDL